MSCYIHVQLELHELNIMIFTWTHRGYSFSFFNWHSFYIFINKESWSGGLRCDPIQLFTHCLYEPLTTVHKNLVTSYNFLDIHRHFDIPIIRLTLTGKETGFNFIFIDADNFMSFELVWNKEYAVDWRYSEL
jgi:hypothetical protein